MSEVLVLEFATGTAEHYFAVSKILGIDPVTGEGAWPAPLQSHTAAAGPNGLVVIEVWESQAAQAAFMAQLGPAIAEVGAPEPTRMEWRPLLSHYDA